VVLRDLLDLHGAGGDDHGGRHSRDGLRGERAQPGAQSARRGSAGGRGGGGCTAGSDAGRAREPGPAGGCTAGSGASAEAELGQAELLEEHERPERVDRREGPRRAPQLAAEGAAADARLQMPAGGRRALGEALGDLSQLQPDLAAGEHPGLGGLCQVHARAHEQRLHARHGGVHRLGDLVVGERVDLAEEERRALGLRQLADVGHDLAELLAPVDRLGGRGAVVALEDVHRVLAGGAGLAQVVEAAVARDAVEPGAGVDRTVVAQQGVVGGGEHLLEHVLGVLLGGEHVAAEGKQARLVALHEGIERAVVAGSHQRDQLLVALQAQQGRAAGECGNRCGV
jgi:hypothetical protein